jgi:hypothetical protein
MRVSLESRKLIWVWLGVPRATITRDKARRLIQIIDKVSWDKSETNKKMV